MKIFSAVCILMLTVTMVLSVNGSYAFSNTSGGSLQETAPGQPAGSALSGKVLETMDSGGYTYVNIEKDGKSIWVAVPLLKVTVGQEMSFAPGMTMRSFQSKSLNRTFEEIVFSSGALGQGGKETASKPSPAKKAQPAAVKDVKVEKAAGPNAYTVAELYEKKADLDTKKVTVKGQVVKVSPQIMGKNWIHLQDGSGASSDGTNDILVTSQDLPSVGEVVTAKGTLAKDKDFGQGYNYAVIVEETSIQK